MGHFRCLPLAIYAFLGLTASVAARSDQEEKLLELARDAHRAARESIRTVSCRVEFKGVLNYKKPPEEQTCSGRYWFSPDAVRGQAAESGKEHDYLWKDSVRQVVVYDVVGGKRVAAGANRNSFASRHLERCDPWGRGLLVLNVPGTSDDVPFEQLLAQAATVERTERTTISGKEMIVVHLTFDPRKPDNARWKVEIQFDPEINYLVRRMTYVGSYPKGKYWREYEVDQFKECAPGVFFPEKMTERAGTDKKWDFHGTSLIADIRVNQPLPDGIFNFRYPNGVYLTDSIRKIGYRVDANGNPISVAKPLGGTPPPPIGDLKEPAPAGRETETEPRPMTSWILPISLCIAACGCLGILVRRWRRKVSAA